jgi:hypothetical protein
LEKSEAGSIDRQKIRKGFILWAEEEEQQ